ncbi:hypothetical protein [Arachnia rubra]|uniref:Uncharacterized protein n=1 Tax=Arachnia rubra TaxID=1547448 RepID=A0ABX7Y4S1_9ACTN|nr:hypothetical protein [Arachnia rubra]MBB1571771.1 hypothetical protein [Propionibacterium sp.]MDO4645883.1 hypothetical protein [Propionibacteriaceae bacterium]MBB1576090.1 hypothetical protein [Propionibacterium sp.]QUC08056.1 hypothetical protein J5A65_14305 [Arachnia rubra]BCR82419.1 hypothetical protein SK1NUM_28620 [Arachnia rubra]
MPITHSQPDSVGDHVAHGCAVCERPGFHAGSEVVGPRRPDPGHPDSGYTHTGEAGSAQDRFLTG